MPSGEGLAETDITPQQRLAYRAFSTTVEDQLEEHRDALGHQAQRLVPRSVNTKELWLMDPDIIGLRTWLVVDTVPRYGAHIHLITRDPLNPEGGQVEYEMGEDRVLRRHRLPDDLGIILLGDDVAERYHEEVAATEATSPKPPADVLEVGMLVARLMEGIPFEVKRDEEGFQQLLRAVLGDPSAIDEAPPSQ